MVQTRFFWPCGSGGTYDPRSQSHRIRKGKVGQASSLSYKGSLLKEEYPSPSARESSYQH